MRQGLTCVCPDLYVASLKDLEESDCFSEVDFDVVVNLCGERPVNGYSTGVEVLDYRMEDGDENCLKCFSSALQAVRKRFDSGDTVLVHCTAGLSRSPVMAAAVLSTLNTSSVKQNLERIQDDRMIGPASTVVENAEKAVEQFLD
jgi:protein-tyrosine phosphatase